MIKVIHDDLYYTQADVMQIFKIDSPSTLWRWVKKGLFPKADVNPNTKGKKWLGKTIKRHQNKAA